jgi:hypothetical protein
VNLSFCYKISLSNSKISREKIGGVGGRERGGASVQ